MSPLPLCLLLVAGTLAAPLFAELRQAPPPPGGFVKLAPVVVVAAGQPVAGRVAWEPVRARIAADWQARIGPFPARVPLQTEVLSTEEQPDHTRLLLRYHTERGVTADAYLLLPKGFPGRRPGAVVLHQTSATSLRDPVGLDSREGMHLALHLVRRGYVCIAPRNFLWSVPGRSYQQLTEDVLAHWHTGMAKMTWDAIVATDVLAARPEVNPERLCSLGHSLGGKEVVYHAAFDPRIRAAVSCEGGIGLAFSNWDADWYLGKQIKAPGFVHDQHELLALVAPRAFLLIGGNSADGAQSWPYIEANLPVWRLHDAEERLGLLIHPWGHDFPQPGPVRDRVYEWLDYWLNH